MVGLGYDTLLMQGRTFCTQLKKWFGQKRVANALAESKTEVIVSMGLTWDIAAKAMRLIKLSSFHVHSLGSICYVSYMYRGFTCSS